MYTYACEYSVHTLQCSVCLWLACVCGEKAFYKEMTSRFDDTFVTEKKNKQTKKTILWEIGWLVNLLVRIT